MPLTDPVPSSAFDVLERNVQDTDKFVNQETGTFTNRVGKVIKPIQVIEAEANAAIISLDWTPVGLFAGGVTFTKITDFAIDAVGTQWIYTGAYPFTAAAGTVPSEPLYQVVRVNSLQQLSGLTEPSDLDQVHTRTFANVDTMLAFNGLVVGQTVATRDDNTTRNIVAQADYTGTPDGVRDIQLSGSKVAVYIGGVKAITSLDDYESFAPDNRKFAGAFGLTNVGAVILVGDSITAGTGSTGYKNSYAFQFMRSIWNSLDNGENTDRAFRYETLLNMAQEYARGDIGGAATVGSNYVNGIGATNDALKIPAGETLTITRREIASSDIFYDADASTATSVDFDLNGVVYASRTISGTGIQTTFATNIYDGTRLCNGSDVIGITAVGGDVYVTGLATFRKSSLSPSVFVAAQPAWGYTDVLAKAPILADHVQKLATGKVKLVILNLGTNNIFAGIKKTPDDYVIAVQNLIDSYRTNMGNCKFLVAVPPRANESLFPASLGSYYEYINKIVAFCNDNNHQVMRLDRTVLSDYPSSYCIDGVHPNDEGHAVLAKFLCEQISIPYNKYDYRRIADTAPRHVNVDVAYNGTWGAFSSQQFAVKVQSQNNILSLSGMAQPNGSVSATVATTPVGFRPVRAAFLTVTTNAGTTTLTWNTDGTLVVGTVPAWVSFENINLVLNRT